MRVNTSINADFLPFADKWRVFLEFVQNAQDAAEEVDGNCNVEFLYRQKDGSKIGTVIIENTGSVLPRAALTTGFSTKTYNSSARGKFGEGLKIGCVIALRLGFDVKIRNGSETWEPSIEFAKEYDAKVLGFDIGEGRKNSNRVQVEIQGVDEDYWNDIKENFLFISVPTVFIPLKSGLILTDPKDKGKVFVKGIFICKNSNLQFGYNFINATVDRDRRMVDNLENKCSELMAEAFQKGYLQDEIYSMLRQSSQDVTYLYENSLSEKAIEKIVRLFKEEFGEDSIPVEGKDQSNELESFGIRGIPLNWRLKSIIERGIGSTSDKIKTLKVSASKFYTDEDLSKVELDNLIVAKNAIARALLQLNCSTDSLAKITVVDFVDGKMQGLFSYEDGGIKIARKTLTKLSKVKIILAHEASHIDGDHGVGERAHHRLFEEIVEILLEG